MLHLIAPAAVGATAILAPVLSRWDLLGPEGRLDRYAAWTATPTL
jgi:hypothetical protein